MASGYKILPRAGGDLRWVKSYYDMGNQGGGAKALFRMHDVFLLLSERPQIGPLAGQAPRRWFSVPGMPFTVVYQLRQDVLEIVRILDQRSGKYLSNLYGHLE